MKNNWVVAQPQADFDVTASKIDIHPAILAVLSKRNFRNLSEIKTFLNPSLQALQDPYALRDMSKAVGRIQTAIANKEKILIYGDYDVDGLTSTAILFLVLSKLGAECFVHIPHRIKDGYGVNKAALEKWLKKKISLVITVDNGMTASEEIEYLSGKKVDTIVVDHHVPKSGPPPAFAIVTESLSCDKDAVINLAACGLAFKLGWALLGSFEEAREYLDLVALGTVADIAPVIGENRIFLKFGLEALLKTKRAGLKELMKCAGISAHRLNYRDVAFGLGPRINASGRMGSPENAFKLLITTNLTEAQNLAQILDDGNRDRQKVESEAFEEAIEMVERDPLKDQQRILVLHHDKWHEGVIGIVASRLAQKYQRPSIVISMKDGLGKGSGRSIPSFSLFDTVLKCEDLLRSFGGHSQACGLTIHEENLPLFRNRLAELLTADSGPKDFNVPIGIDYELELSQIDLNFLEDLGKLEPFGPGNEKPLFLSKGVRLKSEPRRRGKDTLHAWVTNQDGKMTCEVVGFRAYERWAANPRQQFSAIVYQPSLRNFNGITSIQLELEDWC